MTRLKLYEVHLVLHVVRQAPDEVHRILHVVRLVLNAGFLEERVDSEDLCVDYQVLLCLKMVAEDNERKVVDVNCEV